MKKIFSVLFLFSCLSVQALTWSEVKLAIDNGQAHMNLFDENGRFVGEAEVESEEWNGSELSKYVVRYQPGTILTTVNGVSFIGWVYYSAVDKFFGITEQGVEILWGTAVTVSSQAVGGQFVTGLTGKLEKWDLGGSKELYRLVFRKNGKFVTWAKADGQIKEGWNQTAQGIRYEIRWADGRLADSALASTQLLVNGRYNPRAFVCYSTQTCPGLAIRDTESGRNNGKFMTVVFGTLGVDNRCYYHARSEKSLDAQTSGNVITHIPLTHLKALCRK